MRSLRRGQGLIRRPHNVWVVRAREAGPHRWREVRQPCLTAAVFATALKVLRTNAATAASSRTTVTTTTAANINTSSTAQPRCIECPRGHYANGIDMKICKECDEGYYAYFKGSAACQPCSMERWTSGVASPTCGKGRAQ
jgi:hypothetical protein